MARKLENVERSIFYGNGLGIYDLIDSYKDHVITIEGFYNTCSSTLNVKVYKVINGNVIKVYCANNYERKLFGNVDNAYQTTHKKIANFIKLNIV